MRVNRRQDNRWQTTKSHSGSQQQRSEGFLSSSTPRERLGVGLLLARDTGKQVLWRSFEILMLAPTVVPMNTKSCFTRTHPFVIVPQGYVRKHSPLVLFFSDVLDSWEKETDHRETCFWTQLFVPGLCLSFLGLSSWLNLLVSRTWLSFNSIFLGRFYIHQTNQWHKYCSLS